MVWLYVGEDAFHIPDGTSNLYEGEQIFSLLVFLYKVIRLILLLTHSGLWDKYSSIFPSVWVASAFKGATGSCQQLPILPHHVSNHEQWLKELPVIASKFSTFRGVALTGWSRYVCFITPFLCNLKLVNAFL